MSEHPYNERRPWCNHCQDYVSYPHACSRRNLSDTTDFAGEGKCGHCLDGNCPSCDTNFAGRIAALEAEVRMVNHQREAGASVIREQATEIARLQKKANIADCLEEYVQHTSTCEMPQSWSPGEPDPTTKCTCGLVILIRTLNSLDLDDSH